MHQTIEPTFTAVPALSEDVPAPARPSVPVDTLVFDMGNVLMTFDGEAFARVFTDSEEDARLLYRAFFGSREWSLLDAGVITHATLRRCAAARLPGRLLPNLDACIEGWPALSEPLEAVNELAIRMKGEGMGVYLLSNASTHIAGQLDHMPALTALDGWTASAFLRIMKPDPAIYLAFCERFGLDPAACLFIDDNLANCEGARVAGMRAFRFTGDVGELEAAIEDARAGCGPAAGGMDGQGASVGEVPDA